MWYQTSVNTFYNLIFSKQDTDLREVLNPPPVNFSTELGIWGIPSWAGTFGLTKGHYV